MTDVTAQYILKARDDSRGAIASFKRGFEQIDKSVKEATHSLNLMTEIFVGAKAINAIKRFTDNVIQASAAADKDFGKALKGVKENFDALLVPKSGLAGATESMKELSDTLKDPQLVSAADHLSSFLISGFTKIAIQTAHIVEDFNTIFNPKESESLRRKIIHLEAERTRLAPSEPTMGSRFNPTDGKRLAAINLELAAASDQYVAASKRETAADRAAEEAARKLADEKQAFLNLQGKLILDTYALKKAMDEVDAGGEFFKKFGEDAKKAAEAKEAEARAAIKSLEAQSAVKAQHLEATMNENDRMVEDMKKTYGEMDEFAKRAAQNIQDAFANFLFDPFHAGLKGMLVDFLNVIRRMIAEKAAAALLGGGSSGGGGLGSFLGSILGGIFGAGKASAPGTGNFNGPRAGGGSVMGGGAYLVGEKGPELFMPSGNGSIVPNNALGGNTQTVNVSYNVDARGATTDLVAALPGILRQHGEAVKSDIIDGLQRRKYRV